MEASTGSGSVTSTTSATSFTDQMVMMLGQVFGEFEQGVVADVDELADDTDLDEHRERPVRRTLCE